MGKNYVFTIGINCYQNLQALKYAKQDAKVIHDYLKKELSLRPEQNYHFSDDSPPIPQGYGPDLDSRPTYATLRRFLRVRFEQVFLQSSDNLWFFFAGHGRRYKDRDYLMPIDADPGDIENTAISLHYITERLQRCGAGNVMLFLDACRSGDSRARDGLGIGQERQKGVITFFSCSPQESSYEIDELQQGVFTHTLLTGLRMQGKNSCATVEQLDQYLRHRVPELNRYYGKPIQTPYTAIEPLSKYCLILLPHRANPKDMHSLKNEAYKAEIDNKLSLAHELWLRCLSVSPNDTDIIAAIGRIAVKQKQMFPTTKSLPELPNNYSTAQLDNQTRNLPSSRVLRTISSTRVAGDEELHYLLQTEQWQMANQKTEQLMLKATQRQRDGWLDSKAIHQFPIKDLQAIDELWRHYSNDHFGFTIQQRIFAAIHRKEKAFIERVGWTKAALFGGVPFSSAADTNLQFTIAAPEGHLPFVFGGEHGWIFERLGNS